MRKTIHLGPRIRTPDLVYTSLLPQPLDQGGLPAWIKDFFVYAFVHELVGMWRII